MVIATGYNKQYEFEADEWGHGRLLRMGRSREESLSFLRRLSKYVKERGLEPKASRPTNVFESTVQEVENHFRTHPPLEERLRRLESQKPQPIE
jgi:Zn-dependent protease with chaperone function